MLSSRIFRRSFAILVTLGLSTSAVPALGSDGELPTSDSGSNESTAVEAHEYPRLEQPITDNHGTSYYTLHEALESAPAGSKLTLPAGALSLEKSVVIQQSSLTLVTSAATTITRKQAGTGQASIWVANGADLTITATGRTPLTIVGGSVTTVPLFGVDTFGSLTLRGKITIKDVRAPSIDGSVVANAGTLSLTNTRLDFCSSRDGVINNSGTATLDGISANRTNATNNGGVVVNNGTLTLNKGTFVNTSAANLGGAVWAEAGSTTTINNTLFGMQISDRSPGGVAAVAVADGTARVNLDARNLFKQGRRIALLSGAQLHISGTVKKGAALAVHVSDPVPGQPIITFATPAQAAASFPMITFTGTVAELPEGSASVAVSTDKKAAVLALLANPFEDTLGLQPKAELATEEGRRQFIDDVTAYYQQATTDETERRRMVARARALVNNIAYTQTHHDLVAGTVLELSRLGAADANMREAQQSFSLDNRDLTGLYLVRPKAASPTQEGVADAEKTVVFNVFVDSPATANPVELAYRQIGTTDGASYDFASNRFYRLHRGYNRVAIPLRFTKPVALYVRNNSTLATRVRIEAEDASASAQIEAARGTQPVTAAPAILGTQLHTYPVYISDPSHPERFWTYLQALRVWRFDQLLADPLADKNGPNMTDLRFGRQDISAPASGVVNSNTDITTEEAAAERDRTLNAHLEQRLKTFDTFDGFADDDPAPANRPIQLRRVTLFDGTIRYPSTLYAHYGYYHIDGGGLRGFVRGNLHTIFDWANSHEYGHMIDNTFISIPEMTNNMYSIWGNVQQYRNKVLTSAAGTPTPSVNDNKFRVLGGVGDRIDAFMNAHIADPTHDIYSDKRGWARGDVFYRTLTLYSSMRFFDNWDYSSYPFSAKFPRERVEEIKRFGTFGTALRMLRTNRSWLEALVPKGSGDARIPSLYNRMVAMATYASGYNICQFYEKRGYTLLSDAVRSYCNEFPDLPVKLEYFHMSQDLALVGDQIRHDNPLFDATTRAEVRSATPGDGTLTLTLGVTSHEKAVSLYEVYRGDQLLGFTRQPRFVVKNPGDALAASDYRAVAYDYRLRPSTTRYVTLHFDTAEGTGTFPDMSVEAGTHVTLPSVAPTREGYTFTGWKIADDAALYQPGAELNGALLNADLTLTAQWEIVPTWAVPGDAPTVDPQPLPDLTITAVPGDAPTVDPQPLPDLTITAVPTTAPTAEPAPDGTIHIEVPAVDAAAGNGAAAGNAAEAGNSSAPANTAAAETTTSASQSPAATHHEDAAPARMLAVSGSAVITLMIVALLTVAGGIALVRRRQYFNA